MDGQSINQEQNAATNTEMDTQAAAAAEATQEGEKPGTDETTAQADQAGATESADEAEATDTPEDKEGTVTEEAEQQEAAPGPLEAAKQELASTKKELLETQAKLKAAQLGVPDERVPYVLNMAGLSNMDIAADDATDKLLAAIQKAVEDVPELLGGTGTGSAGNFARQKPATTAEKYEQDFQRGLQG